MGYEELLPLAKNAPSALFRFDPCPNAFVGRGRA
jgi:hypothetical protein